MFLGEITFTSSTAVFSENEATYNGGAIWLFKYVLSCDSLSTVILDRNKAQLGGAVFRPYKPENVSYLNISNNFAEDSSGGAFFDGTDSHTELSGTFINNPAINIGGGAVYVQNVNNFTLMCATLIDNSETALLVVKSRVTLKQTKWINNVNNQRHGS